MTTEKFNSSKKVHWVIFVALLIIFLLLQFSAANFRSYWIDEAETARLIQKSFSEISEYINRIHPSLYWWIVSVWAKIFGETEIVIKSFSILCMVFVFVLSYVLASELFDTRVALISILLLTFSPLVLTYGHFARYYSLAAALSLLSAYAAYRYYRNKNWVYLGIYVFSGTLILYTIYIGATVLVALNLWWLIQWIRSERKLMRLITWLFGQVLILFLYSSQIATMLSATGQNIAQESSSSNLLVEAFIRLAYLGYSFSVGEFFSPLNPFLWIGFILVFGLLIKAFINFQENLWLPGIILLVSILIGIGFNLVGVDNRSAWQNLSYRLFYVYPFFLIMLAYGVQTLRWKLFWPVLTVLIIVYSVGIFNYFTNRQVIKSSLVIPWQELFTNIETQSKPDAVVFCTSRDFSCSYYQAFLNFDRLSPKNWEQIKETEPSQIWWIHNNRGDYWTSGADDGDNQVFQSITNQYVETQVFTYVGQDPGITMLKARFLGHEDHEFAVIVYKFDLP